jgi:hypothetical protein
MNRKTGCQRVIESGDRFSQSSASFSIFSPLFDNAANLLIILAPRHSAQLIIYRDIVGLWWGKKGMNRGCLIWAESWRRARARTENIVGAIRIDRLPRISWNSKFVAVKWPTRADIGNMIWASRKRWLFWPWPDTDLDAISDIMRKIKRGKVECLSLPVISP